MKSILEGVFTGEVDKNGTKIYFETTVLKLPNGTLGKLMFDKRTKTTTLLLKK